MFAISIFAYFNFAEHTPTNIELLPYNITVYFNFVTDQIFEAT